MKSVFLLTASLTSFLVTLTVIPSIVQIADKIYLLHKPGKKSNRIIPPFGGIALFIGTMLSSVLYLQDDSFIQWQYLYAAITLLLFPAFIDDMEKLITWKKMGIQLMAALILVLGANIRISHMYGLFAVALLPDWLSITVSIAFILFMIKATDTTNKIPGLTGSVCLLSSFLLGTAFTFSGNTDYAILCVALSGSLLAFLHFNISSGINRINLGNTGSAILGILLSSAIISFNEIAGAAPFHFLMPPVLLIALLIIPITGMAILTFYRIIRKYAPRSFPYAFVYQPLETIGFSPAATISLALGYTLLLIGSTLLFETLKLNITVAFLLLLSLSSLCTWVTYRVISPRMKKKTLKYKPSERIKIVKLYTQKKMTRLQGKPDISLSEKQTLFLN